MKISQTFHIFLSVTAMSLLSSMLLADTIMEKIEKGHLGEARDMIGQESSAAVRDGDLLFYQGLLESDGEESLRFLETAVRTGMAPENLERATYLTAQYYLADGNNEKAISTARAYLQRWENGRYRRQILRLASVAYEREAQVDNCHRLSNNLFQENRGEMYGALAEIDMARRLYLGKDYIEAQNICRRLTNSSYAEAAAPAMFMLSKYSIEQNRTDDAILYYNLMRERFDNAIGIDNLVDRFANLSNYGSDSNAERITGSVYSIQVGVFSSKGNAKNFANDMKKYGEKVEIDEKEISGRRYHVVYVGKFLNTQEALAFKTRLENAEGEAFQIVAR